MAALKTCPFCKSPPSICEHTNITDPTNHFSEGFSVWCGECGFEIHDESRDVIERLWNVRKQKNAAHLSGEE